MNKSIIERIFPHPSNSILPQYEAAPEHVSTTSSPPRIALRDSSRSSQSSPASLRASLRQSQSSTTPAFVRHESPFLPVERASKSLQRTIQDLLDAQSDGLNASLGAETDDASSVGSPTPTPSATTPSRTIPGLKTVPVRQPLPKKIPLRAARKNLARSMQDFARLKIEELRVIESEYNDRRHAIDKTEVMESKKQSLEMEMAGVQQDQAAVSATNLRTEAEKMESEIRELEDKLFEMKARHRHIINQAKQLENSVDSKLSSYKASVALIEKDIKHFLRHPPVLNELSTAETFASPTQGMYSLKADRRTLRMAQDQWSTEQEWLLRRKDEAQAEQQALQQGARIWKEAVRKVNDFEKQLRDSLRQTDVDSSALPQRAEPDGQNIQLTLSRLIASLESDLSNAEENNWNLLICCIGAELEVLRQALGMLGGDLGHPPGDADNKTEASLTRVQMEDGDPPDDLLRDIAETNSDRNRSSSVGSNQSLKDTMREFAPNQENETVSAPDESPRGIADSTSSRRNGSNGRKLVVTRSESEDDEPGPDLFLSHR